MLNGLDLFSGIGGISSALSNWVRPIVYCEIDPYCQAVLLSKMAKGQLNVSPIWDDIRSLNARDIPSPFVDIIYGGFPCQDISIAGHGKGLEGERSGLYWEIHRLAKEILPKFIFLENVPAICIKGGWEVVSSLAEIGYDCRWCVISASSIGALHIRARWFLLAYSHCNGLERFGERAVSAGSKESMYPSGGQDVADPLSEKCAGLSIRKKEGQPSTRVCSQYATIDEWQKAVSTICRVADGVPFRLDRLRALGNAVVPEQAKAAFKYLMGLE